MVFRLLFISVALIFVSCRTTSSQPKPTTFDGVSPIFSYDEKIFEYQVVDAENELVISEESFAIYPVEIPAKSGNIMPLVNFNLPLKAEFAELKVTSLDQPDTESILVKITTSSHAIAGVPSGVVSIEVRACVDAAHALKKNTPCGPALSKTFLQEPPIEEQITNQFALIARKADSIQALGKHVFHSSETYLKNFDQCQSKERARKLFPPQMAEAFVGAGAVAIGEAMIQGDEFIEFKDGQQRISNSFGHGNFFEIEADTPGDSSGKDDGDDKYALFSFAGAALTVAGSYYYTHILPKAISFSAEKTAEGIRATENFLKTPIEVPDDLKVDISKVSDPVEAKRLKDLQSSITRKKILKGAIIGVGVVAGIAMLGYLIKNGDASLKEVGTEYVSDVSDELSLEASNLDSCSTLRSMIESVLSISEEAAEQREELDGLKAELKVLLQERSENQTPG